MFSSLKILNNYTLLVKVSSIFIFFLSPFVLYRPYRARMTHIALKAKSLCISL